MLDCLLMRLLRLDMLHYRSFFASQSWDYPGFCCVLITLAEVSVHPTKFILLYRFSISSKSTCRSFRSHCKEERFSILFCIPWDTAKIHFGIQFLFTLLASRRQGIGEPSGSQTLESRSSFHRVTLRKDWRFVRSNMMIQPLASR